MILGARMYRRCQSWWVISADPIRSSTDHCLPHFSTVIVSCQLTTKFCQRQRMRKNKGKEKSIHSPPKFDSIIAPALNIWYSCTAYIDVHSLATKTRIYPALVQSVLLDASETWTVLSVDWRRALEAFHMKCQRQLLQIKWHQFIRNVADDVPAHKALSSQINLSLGRPPNNKSSRHPCRPRNRWVDQIQRDNNLPPADLWRRAVNHGHHGATLRPMPPMR